MKLTLLAMTVFLFSTAVFADMKFARDSRLVDGNKQTLSVTNENTRFEASVKLVVESIRTPGVEVAIDESDLDCKTARDSRSQQIVEVHCSKDLRRVDGPKLDISITLNKRLGGYDVVRTSTFFNRRTGLEEIKKSKVASNLLQK